MKLDTVPKSIYVRQEDPVHLEAFTSQRGYWTIFFAESWYLAWLLDVFDEDNPYPKESTFLSLFVRVYAFAFNILLGYNLHPLIKYASDDKLWIVLLGMALFSGAYLVNFIAANKILHLYAYHFLHSDRHWIEWFAARGFLEALYVLLGCHFLLIVAPGWYIFTTLASHSSGPQFISVVVLDAFLFASIGMIGVWYKVKGYGRLV